MRRERSRESGNVIMIILIGVVLFGALSYAVNSGYRNGGATTAASQQKLDLQVTDLLTTMNNVSNAVKVVMTANGCTDAQLNFQATGWASSSSYVNSSSPSDYSCNIFDPRGGAVRFTVPNPAIIDTGTSGSGWNIAGSRRVVGIDTTAPELNLYLIRVTKAFCQAFNKKFNIVQSGLDVPQNSFSNEFFTGTYTAGDSIGNLATATSLANKPAGCFQSTTGGSAGTYVVYMVLLPR